MYSVSMIIIVKTITVETLQMIIWAKNGAIDHTKESYHNSSIAILLISTQILSLVHVMCAIRP